MTVQGLCERESNPSPLGIFAMDINKQNQREEKMRHRLDQARAKEHRRGRVSLIPILAFYEVVKFEPKLKG